jgi:hypothetical protein
MSKYSDGFPAFPLLYIGIIAKDIVRLRNSPKKERSEPTRLM